MDWLRRLGRSPATGDEEPEEKAPTWTERSTPGVAELFRGLAQDRTHAVLDLGPAAESSLEVYSRFARWMRFADLLGAAAEPGGWSGVLSALSPHPERPYDLVLGWDILDRIPPEERPRLMKRIVEITASDARLHMMVAASGRTATPALRFTLVDVDRMRYEPVGPPRATWPPLFPAEVERLVEPFRVVRAFTSKVGFREYVAVRRRG
jgi:hypothetical protein